MYHYVKDQTDGLEWLQWDAFAPWPELVHGFSSRTGGVSKAPWNSLNLSFRREPEPEAVKENFRRAARSLGFQAEDVVCVSQVHGKDVLVVTDAHKGQGVVKESPGAYDGMVCNRPGVVLCTIHGDCVPVFFWDPVKRAFGVAHSGWKGTVLQIAGELVRTMQTEYGSHPADLLVAVGPAIQQEWFEVGEEVFQAFAEVFPVQMSDVTFVRAHPERRGKWLLSLPRYVEQTLLAAGVLPEHLSVCDICTASEPDRYYSHRRDRGMTGAMGAMMALREGGAKK